MIGALLLIGLAIVGVVAYFAMAALLDILNEYEESEL